MLKNSEVDLGACRLESYTDRAFSEYEVWRENAKKEKDHTF